MQTLASSFLQLGDAQNTFAAGNTYTAIVSAQDSSRGIRCRFCICISICNSVRTPNLDNFTIGVKGRHGEWIECPHALRELLGV